MPAKEGRFGATSEQANLDSMIARVKSGEVDWSHWKDWLVLGQYEEGVLDEIVVAKVVRTILVKGK